MLNVTTKLDMLKGAQEHIDSQPELKGHVKLDFSDKRKSSADLSLKVITDLPLTEELKEKIANVLYDYLKKYGITLDFEWECISEEKTETGLTRRDISVMVWIIMWTLFYLFPAIYALLSSNIWAYLWIFIGPPVIHIAYYLIATIFGLEQFASTFKEENYSYREDDDDDCFGPYPIDYSCPFSAAYWAGKDRLSPMSRR